MIASLCEAYHWTYHEALRLTLPQIIMLNHAAYVNHERYEKEAKQDGSRPAKKSTDMTTDELQMMFGDMQGGFNVISETGS